MKLKKCGIYLFIVLCCILTIYFFETNFWPVGTNIACLILGLVLPKLGNSIEDICDTTNWKTSQRKLLRGKLINDNTFIRISFAYLYRIKSGNKYLLVKNERGTGKYQPVGGVYQFDEDERLNLQRLFQIIDDNKIPIDESSRNDYRLRMENKYLRKFIKYFDKHKKRENIEDLSREFREELIEKGIVNWDEISYRYCGRHITDLKFGEHFQIYEILLADIVELLPTESQRNDLKSLEEKSSEQYRFATAEEISSFGVNTALGQFKDEIANHTVKILEENQCKLSKEMNDSKVHTIKL